LIFCTEFKDEAMSPLYLAMAAIIFFGTLISMILVVTVLPVVYWLTCKKQDNVLIER
jgi:Ni,Fe-hydrogenase I cytochrome b subunit